MRNLISATTSAMFGTPQRACPSPQAVCALPETGCASPETTSGKGKGAIGTVFALCAWAVLFAGQARADCDPVDFDRNGIVQPLDQHLFLRSWVIGGTCSGCGDRDFNNDGIAGGFFDLEAFASRFAGGPCVTAANSGIIFLSTPCIPDSDFNNDDVFPDETDLLDWIGAFTGFDSNCGAVVTCDSPDFNANGTIDVYDLIALVFTQADGPCVIGTLPGGTPTCDDIDFNNNQVFPEDQDVIDFFNVLAGASCPACNDIDFNNNGVFPEDADVIDFFNVLAGGTCP